MMAIPQWPAADKRTLIGKRSNRLDGPVKSTGKAKYAHDIQRDKLLHAKCVLAPYASAKVLNIDLGPAKAIPGVVDGWIDDRLIGGQVEYAGEIVAVVVAETEEIAAAAVRHVKVDYEPLPHQVVDTDPALSEGDKRPASRTEGDPDAAFAAAHKVVEGDYGLPVITHCCLEPHGQVTEYKDGALYVWPSTQSVTGYADGLGDTIEVSRDKVHVDCQYLGGGFGSKFSFDKWGRIGAVLTKQTGRPVKLMLDRAEELMIAGNRPSAYSKIKVAVDKDGMVTAIESDTWGTGGAGGYRPPDVPYIFTKIPNVRRTGRAIKTNRGGQRAWRAPGHPQACFLTMAALEDAAAAIGMDALEFFKKNVDLTDRGDLYRQQLDIAAEMIGYKQKAHPRGDKTPGAWKSGLGIGLHTWGGRGHDSECDAVIHPDGAVEVRLGTQDLGSGTRTAVGVVAADTLGLPLDAVTVKIGSNAYPPSGASGGSTTVGGVTPSTLIACTNALNALFEILAPKLGTTPDQLEARGGQIRLISDPSKAIAWKEACAALGTQPLTKRGVSQPGESQKAGLIDAGVGGVQIADVSVNVETGVVVLNEMAAVQDCGLIVDLKMTESQTYGGMIMGITYSLYEECVYDATTGRMLNADMEFYRLAGLKDVGKLKVHMMTGPGFDERGVIGIGEPPVIAPGAAISNAVANAIGVRVPHLPLTPDRVLNALLDGGIA